MKIKPPHRQRGVTLLGLLGMVVMLAAMTALILDRSFETCQAGELLERKLQARAAAEGMAVLTAADPAKPPAPQSMGAAEVSCGEPAVTGQNVSIPLRVVVHAGDHPDFTARFTARFVRDGAAWRLLRVED